MLEHEQTGAPAFAEVDELDQHASDDLPASGPIKAGARWYHLLSGRGWRAGSKAFEAKAAANPLRTRVGSTTALPSSRSASRTSIADMLLLSDRCNRAPATDKRS